MNEFDLHNLLNEEKGLPANRRKLLKQTVMDRIALEQMQPQLVIEEEVVTSTQQNNKPDQNDYFASQREPITSVTGVGGKSRRSLVVAFASLALIAAGVSAYLGFGDGSANQIDSVSEIQTANEGEGASVDSTPGDTTAPIEAPAEAPVEPVTDLDSTYVSFQVDSLSVLESSGEQYQPNATVASRGMEWPADPNEVPNPDQPYNRDFVDFSIHDGGYLIYTWREVGESGEAVEGGLNFDYASDGTDWWVHRISTTHGKKNFLTNEVYGERFFVEGEFFRTPLGEQYEGDIKIELGPSSDTTGTVTLQAANVQLEPFLEAVECRDSQGSDSLRISGADLQPDGTVSLFEGIGTSSMSPEQTSPSFPGFSALLIDPKTCSEVPNYSEYSFSVTSADESIAVFNAPEYDDGSSVFDSIGGFIEFRDVGETTLTVTATDLSDDSLVDSVEIPVRSVEWNDDFLD